MKLSFKQVGSLVQSRLVSLFSSCSSVLFFISASNLASLSHTRAGITDAMITCDIVNILSDKQYNKNEQIRFASAVTLGYLTFNRTASRLLLHNCRNKTTLFDTLMRNLRKDSKISPEFIASYKTALELGLPKLLVNNKVRFADTSKSPVRESRAGYVSQLERNSGSGERNNSIYSNRAQSAPLSLLLNEQQEQKKLINMRPKTQINKRPLTTARNKK
jgi:hypothetical protein